MDRRIEIQTSAAARSTTGQELLEWTCLVRCWAAVAFPMTGSAEKVDGDQKVATTRTEFYIRYRDGLNEKMRVLYNGQYYDIMNIVEVGRKEFMTLEAQKQV